MKVKKNTLFSKHLGFPSSSKLFKSILQNVSNEKKSSNI